MPKNVLLLKKQRSLKNKKLIELRAKAKKLRADEEALQQQLEAVEDEIPADLEAQIEELTAAQTEVNDQIGTLVDELAALDATLSEVDDAISEPSPDEDTGMRSRRSAVPEGAFRSRSRCFASRTSRDAFYASQPVKEFLQRVRTMLPVNRRGVKGAELSIPDVMLEVLRDNLNQYSKLISKVRLRNVSGTARMNIIGKVPEGIWMEMAGALNELTFSITDIETDGYKVGGFIALDNFLLSDSDLALGEEIMYMLGQSIGLALDKAIVFGKGKNSKMPTGIVTRLAQVSEPADWGENRAPWTDLHTSNVLQLNLATNNGVDFFRPLLTALAKAKPTYTTDGKLWIMNELTAQDLKIRALEFNSNAALVSGVENVMPIIGGEIVTLEFMPDHMIAGGYLSEYLLVEREGGSFAASDLPMFLADKTVYKGTARYDGQPIEGEAFVAVTYDNTAVTTSMSFSSDYANERPNALVVTSAAGVTSKTTVLTVAGVRSSGNRLAAKIGSAADVTMGRALSGGGWEDIKSGVTEVKATTGNGVTVVELDEDGKAVSVGYIASVTART